MPISWTRRMLVHVHCEAWYSPSEFVLFPGGFPSSEGHSTSWSSSHKFMYHLPTCTSLLQANVFHHSDFYHSAVRTFSIFSHCCNGQSSSQTSKSPSSLQDTKEEDSAEKLQRESVGGIVSVFILWSKLPFYVLCCLSSWQISWCIPGRPNCSSQCTDWPEFSKFLCKRLKMSLEWIIEGFHCIVASIYAFECGPCHRKFLLML